MQKKVLLITAIALSQFFSNGLAVQQQSKHTQHHKQVRQKPAATPKKSLNQLPKGKIIPVGVIDLAATKTLLEFYEILDEYVSSPAIKAIILNLEGVDEVVPDSAVFSEIRKAGKKKPVVAVIAGRCVTSCYYVAAGANKVIANPTGLVGEIGSGIIIERFKDARIKTDQFTSKVNYTFFHKGKYKGIFFPYAPEVTPAQKQHVDELLQDLYDQMCEDIAAARGLSLEKRDVWADGKFFSGRRAARKHIGLVDVLGTMSDTRKVIRTLLKEQGKPAEGKMIFIKQKKEEQTPPQSCDNCNVR